MSNTFRELADSFDIKYDRINVKNISIHNTHTAKAKEARPRNLPLIYFDTFFVGDFTPLAYTLSCGTLLRLKYQYRKDKTGL